VELTALAHRLPSWIKGSSIPGKEWIRGKGRDGVWEEWDWEGYRRRKVGREGGRGEGRRWTLAIALRLIDAPAAVTASRLTGVNYTATRNDISMLCHQPTTCQRCATD